MVLKATKTRFLPDYIRALLVAGTYFVTTASTQQFSEAGNNFAKSFATIIIFGHYTMLIWYLLTAVLGFILGFILFRLLHSSDKRASRIDLDTRDIMEHSQRPREESRDDESELREEKRPREI
jgi:predicted membrane protein